MVRRPLRVLAYSDSAVFGGAESFFASAVAELSRRPALEVAAAAPHENAELAAALRTAAPGAPLVDVPAQPLRLAGLHLLDPRRVAAVRRALAPAPDVVFVNLPSAEYGAAPLLALAGRARLVCLLHIHHDFAELGFRLGRARRAAARRATRRAHALLTLSPGAAGVAARLWAGPGASVETVPMPRPRVAGRERAAARRELGLPEGLLVGIVGRLTVKQKGHDVFVEAAATLRDRLPGVRFVVAGSGSDEPLVRRLIRSRGLDDAFVFLGPVKPVDDLLAALDLIAIPSRFEGMPLVALEAIEAGLPGVASRIDGLASVWPSEWQVPPGDPEALAEALERVAREDEAARRDALARAARTMEGHVTDDLGAVFEARLLEAADAAAGEAAGRPSPEPLATRR